MHLANFVALEFAGRHKNNLDYFNSRGWVDADVGVRGSAMGVRGDLLQTRLALRQHSEKAAGPRLDHVIILQAWNRVQSPEHALAGEAQRERGVPDGMVLVAVVVVAVMRVIVVVVRSIITRASTTNSMQGRQGPALPLVHSWPGSMNSSVMRWSQRLLQPILLKQSSQPAHDDAAHHPCVKRHRRRARRHG